MDVQALAARDKVYLYDDLYRSRETLSCAQRAAYGFRSRSLPLTLDKGKIFLHALRPALRAPLDTTARFVRVKERVDQNLRIGMREHRRRRRLLIIHKAALERLNNARSTSSSNAVATPHAPFRAYTSVSFSSATATLRCTIWRGRVFLSSRRKNTTDA